MGTLCGFRQAKNGLSHYSCQPKLHIDLVDYKNTSIILLQITYRESETNTFYYTEFQMREKN